MGDMPTLAGFEDMTNPDLIAILRDGDKGQAHTLDLDRPPPIRPLPLRRVGCGGTRQSGNP
ncbi:hypothetical protein [Paenirhodobacter populi]|uniref:Uncharacterized protein n=1 Tax=Paenirhodobacter populi TaxID=2306993 RepID=A0A443JPV2_9RHOB|nr:hypothetical protein [Sinirhodobacter populi]RWR22533.1 hypothetical protein D2T30_06205 [Sinirhodobacter populi]